MFARSAQTFLGFWYGICWKYPLFVFVVCFDHPLNNLKLFESHPSFCPAPSHHIFAKFTLILPKIGRFFSKIRKFPENRPLKKMTKFRFEKGSFIYQRGVIGTLFRSTSPIPLVTWVPPPPPHPHLGLHCNTQLGGGATSKVFFYSSAGWFLFVTEGR